MYIVSPTSAGRLVFSPLRTAASALHSYAVHLIATLYSRYEQGACLTATTAEQPLAKSRHSKQAPPPTALIGRVGAVVQRKGRSVIVPSSR